MDYFGQDKRAPIRGGVVLTAEWRDKLFTAMQKKWEESDEDPGAKLTVEKQVRLSTLNKRTWVRILKGKEGVHKSTLEAVFAAVELKWDKSKESEYYTLPPLRESPKNEHSLKESDI